MDLLGVLTVLLAILGLSVAFFDNSANLILKTTGKFISIIKY